MRKLLSLFCVSLFAVFNPVFGQTDEREKGIGSYRSGDYAEAVSMLQKVVEADPTDKVAWTYLGGSLMHLGREDEALAAFRKPVGGPNYDGKLDKELKIKKRAFARYTPEARENSVNGTVFMAVEFKADGTVGFVVPIKELPFGLTEAAVASAKATVFSPAVKNEVQIPVIKFISTEFRIY